MIAGACAAGFATPLEQLVLGALMAVPLAAACAAGHGSVALAFAYVLGFDNLRAMGHCNVEVFPGGLFQSLPVLKYLIYTPTYVHSISIPFSNSENSFEILTQNLNLHQN